MGNKSFLITLALLVIIDSFSAIARSAENPSTCDRQATPAQNGQHLTAASTKSETYLLNINNPIERKQAIETYIGPWLKKDQSGVISWVENISDMAVQAAVADYTVSRLSKENPGAAADLLRFVRSKEIRSELLSQVLQAWMKTDWQSALAWSQQLPPSRLKEEAIIHLGYRWLEVDPYGALDYTANLGSCNSQLMTTLAGQWAAIDSSGTAAWAAGLSNAELRKKTLPDVIAIWANISPGDAANFVLNLPDDATRDETLISVVSAWSHKDPEAAIAWLDQIPESIAKQRAIQQAVTIWASTAPEAAGSWLKQKAADDSRDAALVSYSTLLEHSSVAQAFQWAEQIQDQDIRAHQLEFVGKTWLRKDPADAEAAILQSSLLDDQKRRLLNTALRSETNNQR
jgi:hypothetical protein